MDNNIIGITINNEITKIDKNFLTLEINQSICHLTTINNPRFLNSDICFSFNGEDRVIRNFSSETLRVHVMNYLGNITYVQIFKDVLGSVIEEEFIYTRDNITLKKYMNIFVLN